MAIDARDDILPRSVFGPEAGLGLDRRDVPIGQGLEQQWDPAQKATQHDDDGWGGLYRLSFLHICASDNMFCCGRKNAVASEGCSNGRGGLSDFRIRTRFLPIRVETFGDF